MVRRFVLAAALGLAGASGCLLLTDLHGFSGGGGDGGAPEDAIASGSDAPADVATDTSAAPDTGTDGSTCTCGNLVSAYRFSDANALGRDMFGKNNMTTVRGSPKQSSIVPPGLTGSSIQLDGSSTVCIDSGYTFDSTADHTLCWWSRPAALADNTNQFAQTCSYDTWTASSGVDYLWRINNCNNGVPANLQVPNVYAVNNWVQVCQTYKRSSMTRTVVINGKTAQKTSINDTVPILKSPPSPWCIGSYGGGGFWTGLIYQPMWFDRILTDAEIQAIQSTACCLP